jgi:hypothetical protein
MFVLKLLLDITEHAKDDTMLGLKYFEQAVKGLKYKELLKYLRSLQTSQEGIFSMEFIVSALDTCSKFLVEQICFILMCSLWWQKTV